MSTQTSGDLKLIKPEVNDNIDQTIGIDLPANFQKIDAEVTNRVKKEPDKGLSTNDYTNEEKLKLANIAVEATKVEDSTTNGNIKVNGQEVKVYDETNINSRIDAIITTPAEGVSVQEIIDARQGEASLGAKLTKFGEQINSLDAEVTEIPNQSYITEKAKSIDVNNALALKANQTDLNQTNNDVDATNLRIDNLVIPISPENVNIEVTDAHNSIVKNKNFVSLKARLEESEQDLERLDEQVTDSRVGSNGESYATTGDAVRILGNSLDYKESKNLIDMSKIVSNQGVNGLGAVVSMTDIAVTAPIYVKSGKTVYFSMNSALGSVFRISAYDFKGKFIENTANYISSYIIPNNCSYLRLSMDIGLLTKRLQLEYDKVTFYEPFFESSYKVDNLKSIEKYVDKKYLYEWVISGTNATGVNVTDINRITLKEIQYADDDLIVSSDDFSLYRFAIIYFVDGIMTEDLGWKYAEFVIPKGKYYKIVVARTGANEVALSNVEELLQHISITFNGCLAELKKEWIKITELTSFWIGGIGANGEKVSDTTRISSNIMWLGKSSVIAFPTGYVFRIFNYDENGVFIEPESYSWKSTPTYKIESDGYYSIYIAGASYGVLSGTDIIALNDTSILLFNPKTLTQEVHEFKVSDAIPTYYNDYLSGKVNTINVLEQAAGTNGETFGFVTDIHWHNNKKRSPLLIKYLKNKINLYNFFNGGDLISSGLKNDVIAIERDCIRAYRDAFGDRMFYLAANHDMNYYHPDTSQRLTYGELYAITSKQYEYHIINGGDGYYYFDNPTQKIRYICLNSGIDGEMDSTQLTWFNDIALNLPTGYTAVILIHWLYSTINEVDTITISGQSMVDICNNYRNSHTTETIACVLFGHTHKDISYISASGMPLINTTADAVQTDVEGSTERLYGTTNEQAFDIFVINRETRAINTVRIGYGLDRVFSY